MKFTTRFSGRKKKVQQTRTAKILPAYFIIVSIKRCRFRVISYPLCSRQARENDFERGRWEIDTISTRLSMSIKKKRQTPSSKLNNLVPEGAAEVYVRVRSFQSLHFSSSMTKNKADIVATEMNESLFLAFSKIGWYFGQFLSFRNEFLSIFDIFPYVLYQKFRQLICIICASSPAFSWDMPSQWFLSYPAATVANQTFGQAISQVTYAWDSIQFIGSLKVFSPNLIYYGLLTVRSRFHFCFGCQSLFKKRGNMQSKQYWAPGAWCFQHNAFRIWGYYGWKGLCKLCFQ